MENQNTGAAPVGNNSPQQQNTNNNTQDTRRPYRRAYHHRAGDITGIKFQSDSADQGTRNTSQGPARRFNPNQNRNNPRPQGQGQNRNGGGYRRQGGQNRGRFNPNQNRNQGQSGTVKRVRYPQDMIQTANARGWNSIKDYQFKDDYKDSKVRIIPISGVEMIGTNCTVIEYENDIMIIDAGLGFPGLDETGIDALVPNLSYLYDKLDKVRGLVITHGHTDHIGGLHQIYDKIGFPPIYAPRLAAEMIREKFKETGFADRAKINEIDGDSSYYLGKFHLSHFRMNHTIMDNYGICIDTPVGRIVTPSDYKFDFTPYKESPSDYSKLTKMGDEGILLLMDESTNIKHKGWAPSESAIAHDLEDTIRDAEGRLIIGMFSTMISRIRQVVEISARHGKKVAVMGRSLDTNVKISHKLGYIDVLNNTFIPIEEADNYPEDKIVVITTGSQGEGNAALMRLALDEHKRMKLRKSDTVVFSSSRIPGNETKIDKLINLIAEKGCRILTNDHLTLHASGHGCMEDHKLMLQLTKPKFLMPIHGEPSMLTAAKEQAMLMGMKEDNVILAHNGSVIELWPDGWNIVETIESTPLWVESNRVGDFDPELVKERQLMSDEGILFITIKNFDKPQITTADLEIIGKGFFIQRSDTFLQNELPVSVVDNVNRMNGDREKDQIKSAITRLVEREVEQRYEQKKPLIVVSVI